MLRHRLFRRSARGCGLGALCCGCIHRCRSITLRRSGSRRYLRSALINALSRRKPGRSQQGRNGHGNHQRLFHLIFQFKIESLPTNVSSGLNGPHDLKFRFCLGWEDVMRQFSQRDGLPVAPGEQHELSLSRSSRQEASKAASVGGLFHCSSSCEMSVVSATLSSSGFWWLVLVRHRNQ